VEDLHSVVYQYNPPLDSTCEYLCCDRPEVCGESKSRVPTRATHWDLWVWRVWTQNFIGSYAFLVAGHCFQVTFCMLAHSFLCNLCYGSFSIQQVCRTDYMFELFRMSMRNGHVCMFGEGHVHMDTGCWCTCFSCPFCRKVSNCLFSLACRFFNFSISAIFCFVYFLLASIVSYLIGSARGCLFIWNSNLWILWLSPIKLFTLLLSLDMSLLSSVGVPNLVVWKLCTLPQGFWGITGARDSVHFGHWCTLLSMSKEWSNLPAKSYRDGWEKTVPLHGMCLISCLLALNHESQKFATGLLWSLVDRP
jgi:hypothetical protein